MSFSLSVVDILPAPSTDGRCNNNTLFTSNHISYQHACLPDSALDLFQNYHNFMM